jgi:hypothetical protein
MHTMHSVQVKEGKKAGMVSQKYTTSAREQIWNLLLGPNVGGWSENQSFESCFGFFKVRRVLYKTKERGALMSKRAIVADCYFVFVWTSALKIVIINLLANACKRLLSNYLFNRVLINIYHSWSEMIRVHC